MSQDAFDEFMDKKFKADYLSLQMKFLDFLKNITLRLKELPIEERSTILFKKLSFINNWMDKHVREVIT